MALQKEERQVSGHGGASTWDSRGAPQPGRPEIFLWHPAEQTAGTVPGWQSQPGSRAQTRLGVAGEHSQAGEVRTQPAALRAARPGSLREGSPVPPKGQAGSWHSLPMQVT